MHGIDLQLPKPSTNFFDLNREDSLGWNVAVALLTAFTTGAGDT